MSDEFRSKYAMDWGYLNLISSVRIKQLGGTLLGLKITNSIGEFIGVVCVTNNSRILKSSLPVG
jgi:hypothetical protein